MIYLEILFEFLGIFIGYQVWCLKPSGISSGVGYKHTVVLWRLNVVLNFVIATRGIVWLFLRGELITIPLVGVSAFISAFLAWHFVVKPRF